MKEGVLKNGFRYRIPDEKLDDYELLELLAEIDSGNNTLIIKVAPYLLGKEQTDKLKEHIRGENGVVSATKMFEAIGEILTGSKEGKN